MAPYVFRGTLDGADFEPEGGGQPFLQIGAPDLGTVAAVGPVVVVDAETYDGILRWIVAAEQALGYEGIGAGHPGHETVLPAGVLEQAADLLGIGLCGRWELGLIDAAAHTRDCDCRLARSERGEVDPPTEADVAAREEALRLAAEIEKIEVAQRAAGTRKPWDEVDPNDAPEGHAWSFEYRPVTDGTEHERDMVRGTQRWRPVGEAVLVPPLNLSGIERLSSGTVPGG